MCKDNGLKPKKWVIDTPTRWNSTFKLLNDAIKYKVVIIDLYNSDPSHQADDSIITEFHWELASSIRDILESFAHATLVFSYVYEPNVHHIIIECVNIVNALHDFVKKDEFHVIIVDMKIKWIEYFTEFLYIYGVACLLDPR